MRSASASAITPIVFCASFAPWVNAIQVPEKSCPIRNVRLPRPGVIRWNSQKIASRRRKPPANASAGAQSAGIDHLVHEAVPLHAVLARLRERRADEAADQRVRRRRRAARATR